MNIDVVAQASPDITTMLVTMIKEHYPSAILLVILVLLIRYAGQIGQFFKEYFNKKQEYEAKKVEDSRLILNELLATSKDSNKAVDNNTQALNSLEKVFIASEGRTSDKIAGVESRLSEKISGVESRLSDKISNSTKEVVHQTKLDKIASGLSESTRFVTPARATLPSQQEDSYHGDTT